MNAPRSAAVASGMAPEPSTTRPAGPSRPATDRSRAPNESASGGPLTMRDVVGPGCEEPQPMTLGELRSCVREPADERPGPSAWFGVHDADADRAHVPESSRDEGRLRDLPTCPRLHRPRGQPRRDRGHAHRGDRCARRAARVPAAFRLTTLCDRAGRFHRSGRVPQRGRGARRSGRPRSGHRRAAGPRGAQGTRTTIRASAAAPLGAARARSRPAGLRPCQDRGRTDRRLAFGRRAGRSGQGAADPRGSPPGRGDPPVRPRSVGRSRARAGAARMGSHGRDRTARTGPARGPRCRAPDRRVGPGLRRWTPIDAGAASSPPGGQPR